MGNSLDCSTGQHPSSGLPKSDRGNELEVYATPHLPAETELDDEEDSDKDEGQDHVEKGIVDGESVSQRRTTLESQVASERISRGGSRSAWLSESELWKWQQSFYEKAGASCWAEQVVPSFPSSNAFIAHRYARAIFDFALDTNSEETLYIVELGAGSGKLGFHVTERLLGLRQVYEESGGNVNVSFKYILTDFHQGMIDFWIKQPKLQRLIEAGWMDVALSDLQDPSWNFLHLQHSQIPLQLDLARRVVFVANYVFDSLLQDAFQVRGRDLYRAKVEIVRHNDDNNSESMAGDLKPHELGSTFSLYWNYDLCDPKEDVLLGNELLPHASQAEKTAVTQVLREYCEIFAEAKQPTTVLLPLGALRLATQMSKASSSMQGEEESVLLLTADKGFHSTSEFLGLADPHVVVHGSFSFMTNFDAIERFLRKTQPECRIVRSVAQKGFKVFTALFCRSGGYERTCHSLERLCGPFCPEQYSTLHIRFQEEVQESNTLHPLLALMRLGCHDASTFMPFKKAFINRSASPFSSPLVQSEVNRAMANVVETHFPLESNYDIAFEVARVYMSLKAFDKALVLFDMSLRECGDHYITHYNRGICLYFMGKKDNAREAFQVALSKSPGYSGAVDWLSKCEGD